VCFERKNAFSTHFSPPSAPNPAGGEELATFPQDPIAGLKSLVLREGEDEITSKGIEGERAGGGEGNDLVPAVKIY